MEEGSVSGQRTCELAGLAEGTQIEPDLSEWDYGDYEGQRPIDIRNERPDWNIFWRRMSAR